MADVRRLGLSLFQYGLLSIIFAAISVLVVVLLGNDVNADSYIRMALPFGAFSTLIARFTLFKTKTYEPFPEVLIALISGFGGAGFVIWIGLAMYVVGEDEIPINVKSQKKKIIGLLIITLTIIVGSFFLLNY